MNNYIIKVENLGKQYRILHNQGEPYTALRDVVARKAAAPFPSKLLQAHSAGTYEMARQFPGTSVSEKKLLQNVLRIQCRSKNRRL